MPPDIVAKMSDLARHESEHVLQWWSMARLRASEGRVASEIVADMHGIPLDVAQHAERSVAARRHERRRACRRPGVVGQRLLAGHDPRRQPRSAQGAPRAPRAARRRDQSGEGQGEKVDRQKLHERDELREVVAGFDALYRGLPEERIAYDKGGAAGNEARLMELELQVHLADVARRHGVDDLKVIEDDYLAQIAAGKSPEPALASRHARQVERVKALQDRVDTARAEHDAMAQAMTAAGDGHQPGTAPAESPAGEAGAEPAGARQGGPALAGGSAAGPAGSAPVPRNPVVEAGVKRIKAQLERHGRGFEELGLGSARDLGDFLAASSDPAAAVAIVEGVARDMIRDDQIAQTRVELESRGAPTAPDPTGGEGPQKFTRRPPARPDGSIDSVATTRWIRENGLDQPLELGAALRYGALDQLGRPTGIHATLRPGELAGGFDADYQPHGYGGKPANHAMGHLLGNQLGGSGGDPRNIAVLYHIGANTPGMRDIENRVRKAVDAGDTVSYEVTPIYAGDGALPVGVLIKASGRTIQIEESVVNRPA